MKMIYIVLVSISEACARLSRKLDDIAFRIAVREEVKAHYSKADR